MRNFKKFPGLYLRSKREGKNTGHGERGGGEEKGREGR
jgi:hypothetical protein